MKTIQIKTHPLVNLSVKVTDEMVDDYRDCKNQEYGYALAKGYKVMEE